MGTYFGHLCRQDLATLSSWVNFAIDPFHSAYRLIIGFTFHSMWTILDNLIYVGLQNEVILSTGTTWLQHFNKGRNLRSKLSQSFGFTVITGLFSGTTHWLISVSCHSIFRFRSAPDAAAPLSGLRQSCQQRTALEKETNSFSPDFRAERIPQGPGRPDGLYVSAAEHPRGPHGLLATLLGETTDNPSGLQFCDGTRSGGADPGSSDRLQSGWMRLFHVSESDQGAQGRWSVRHHGDWRKPGLLP